MTCYFIWKKITSTYTPWQWHLIHIPISNVSCVSFRNFHVCDQKEHLELYIKTLDILLVNDHVNTTHKLLSTSGYAPMTFTIINQFALATIFSKPIYIKECMTLIPFWLLRKRPLMGMLYISYLQNDESFLFPPTSLWRATVLFWCWRCGYS